MGRGRPKKYPEEDTKTRYKRYNDTRQAKKIASLKPEDVKNLCKKTRINEKDGFVILIETLNRLSMDTIDICFTVNYKYCNGVNWGFIQRGILNTINEWLSGQELYDHKNKIFIFDHPNDDKQYSGEYRAFDFQLYLRRKTPVPSRLWKDMYPEVLPLVEVLKTHIINTSPEEGIEIVRRLSYNRKIREKTLLSEANDACISTSEATEP